jgi:hypothetical protein
MGVVLSMGELRGLVTMRVTSRKTRRSGGGERPVDLAAEAAGEVGERAGALPLEAGVDRGAALRSVPGSAAATVRRQFRRTSPTTRANLSEPASEPASERETHVGARTWTCSFVRPSFGVSRGASSRLLARRGDRQDRSLDVPDTWLRISDSGADWSTNVATYLG